MIEIGFKMCWFLDSSKMNENMKKKRLSPILVENPESGVFRSKITRLG